MAIRFGDRRRPKMTNRTFWKRGGELPCIRCGFRYKKYGPQVKQQLGQFVMCKYCYDSETDGGTN